MGYLYAKTHRLKVTVIPLPSFRPNLLSVGYAGPKYIRQAPTFAKGVLTRRASVPCVGRRFLTPRVTASLQHRQSERMSGVEDKVI